MSDQNHQKGKLLEQVANMFFGWDGAKTTMRAELPSLRTPTTIREIDILIEKKIDIFPVRIAVECKNQQDVVSVEQIDAFVGKLQSIGLQLGIYVCVNGYAEGARTRAAEAGIKLYVIKGLTADRLRQEVLDAIQSTVWLVPHLENFIIESAQKDLRPAIFNKDGVAVGTVFDLAWRQWILHDKNQIKLGKLVLPGDVQGLGTFGDDGTFYSVLSIAYEYVVVAYVVDFEGKSCAPMLIEADTGQISRGRIDTEFIINEGVYDVKSFENEEDLNKYLIGIEANVRYVHRYVVNKLVCYLPNGPIVEPPIKAVLNRIYNAFCADPEGFRLDPVGACSTNINDLQDLFAEPWDEYLATFRERLQSVGLDLK